MPTIAKKPTLNKEFDMHFNSKVPHPGKFDGVNWWVQTQAGGPWIPVEPSFIKEWRAK